MKSSNTPKKEKDTGKKTSNSPPKKTPKKERKKKKDTPKAIYVLIAFNRQQLYKEGVFQRKRLVTQLVIVADSVVCQQKGYRVAGNVVVMDLCV